MALRAFSRTSVAFAIAPSLFWMFACVSQAAHVCNTWRLVYSISTGSGACTLNVRKVVCLGVCALCVSAVRRVGVLWRLHTPPTRTQRRLCLWNTPCASLGEARLRCGDDRHSRGVWPCGAMLADHRAQGGSCQHRLPLRFEGWLLVPPPPSNDIRSAHNRVACLCV